MSLKYSMLVAAVLAAVPTVVGAATVYVGHQGTGTPIANANAINFSGATGAADARSAFLSGLTSVFKEDFQDSAWTQNLSITTSRALTFSDGVNSLPGTYSIRATGSGTATVQTGVLSNWGDFQGLATTPAASNKWLGIHNSLVTMLLNPGQSAVGFFLNDVRDQQTRNVTVSWADGSTTSVLLGSNSGLLGNQNLYFVGMKSNQAITSVSIAGAGSSDGIALDEVIVGTALSGGPTPIPLPASAVSGLGLMALMATRRVRRA
jgi:hypothetical protein